ncbi:protein involved in sex pheromone biosynthesis [Planomicrobium koreense]|jgi:protein involved in sex pheromone biosynthesis|uniref:Protein involved in sex pheromone biosynthesis n=1 Tax=Planococcus koreensis TaxID=112331 RepID=A0A7W8CUS1_9BACL|nr:MULTISPECIES: CamS family sex pheromone protein [Planococcus]MBB5181933.1 protein involved in sex pheromone biosynthesis [Planococcus koreensis]MDN3450858.1 CamS family sex pheromone protein [Planococcus sp. APC 3906]
MKRIWWIPVSLLLLAGCVPSASDEAEVLSTEEEAETAIIPSIQLDDRYYRTLLPYKQSATRGTIINRLNSRYDIEEAEDGLLRLSQRQFSPDDYYFQEGQKITREDASAWLSRKSKENGLGLNAADSRDAKAKEAGDRPSPEILAHIVEQNYLVKTDKETIRLGGVSIGLALNSIYYNSIDEVSYEESIPQAQLDKEGKRMAAEIIKRLREKEGMKDIPITVGLFKQSSRGAIAPGTYFAFGVAPGGENDVANWTPVKEEFVIFPTSGSEDKYRDVDTSFRNFKMDVEEYFSNFTSVIGTGFYQEDQLRSLKVDIPVQFYGSAELIGFTQYLTGLVLEHFPENIEVEVSVTSTNGPEALVIRKAGQTEPIVHIYD